MARDHGFHPVRVTRIIQETADTRTFVLDAPFSYRAGQFLTFRVCGTLRSYSMSSSPDTDSELMTTVKRVPDGLVSNWMHDHLAPGDLVEATRPAGVFCLREVIFGPALSELAGRYPGRLEVRHHLDVRNGLVTGDQVREFIAGDRDGDFYICGPPPFMDLTERALLSCGANPGQIFVERFESVPGAPAGQEQEGTVAIVLAGQRHTVPQHAGETLLESARRAGLSPPFSCEAGNCATCIARVTEGEAKMRVNNALDDDEVAEGWVLTCQGEPVTPQVTVVYED